MKSLVNENSYVAIQSWMVTELGLKGNELIVYAIIYGFSQTRERIFSGSHKYLADWINGTKRGVIKCLKSLVDKGYLRKRVRLENGVRHCDYFAVSPKVKSVHREGEQNSSAVVNKIHHNGEQDSSGGGEQSSHNNIERDIINNNIADTLTHNVCGKDTVEEVISSFNRICTSLPEVRELGSRRRREVENMLKHYSLEKIQEAFFIAETSDFLKGVGRGWKASFDWLMQESNFIKVLEGNYSNNINGCQPAKANEFDSFMDQLTKFVEENE